MFTCSKCNHQWFQRSAKVPRRCPNHSCRSVHWNTTVPLAAKVEQPSTSKEADLAKVRELLENVIKPKPAKVYIPPSIPRVVVDQPDYYSEPTVSYE